MASIDIDNVSLSYPIYDARGRSLKSTVLRTVGGKMSENNGRLEVQALYNISFHLRSGDRLALVGRNGAGKTSLLKVLSGIYEPPFGNVRIEGSISSLTDVTMGMDIDATGRDNIIMRCVFLGMTYTQARQKMAEIEEFTELGPYLSLPVRSYSTGMLVRLGFAASTATRPQILIMDEMIGAGDMAFAEKAQGRINEYIASSHILVLASHNISILHQFCNKALLLDAGHMRLIGGVKEVLEEYERSTR